MSHFSFVLLALFFQDVVNWNRVSRNLISSGASIQEFSHMMFLLFYFTVHCDWGLGWNSFSETPTRQQL